MTFAGGLLIVAMFSHSSENRCSDRNDDHSLGFAGNGKPLAK
jgi:hypothetical protein